MIKTQCPICGQVMQGASPREWPQFPFCSPRCKTIDLGRWLNGSHIEDYAARISPAEDEGEDTASADRDIP